MSRRVSLIVLLATVSLLVPTVASASVLPGRNIASFFVGTRLIVFSGGGKTLAATPGLHRVTSYITGGHTDRTGIVARFGELGRIVLRFVPSGRPTEETAGPHCHGRPALSWEGVYIGTVELRGRYGFRPFHDRSFRTEGSFTKRPRRVCHEPGENRPPRSHGNGVRLWAGACDGRRLNVEGERPRAAAKEEGLELAAYSAHARLRDGRVEVSQDINAWAAPETFSFDEALTTATVTPPAPFHGTGTLVRRPNGSTTWTGTLSATLLGKQVSLAGPAFESGLGSFPRPPFSVSIFATRHGCPAQKAVAAGEKSLLSLHLSALLPSGAR